MAGPGWLSAAMEKFPTCAKSLFFAGHLNQRHGGLSGPNCLHIKRSTTLAVNCPALLESTCTSVVHEFRRRISMPCEFFSHWSRKPKQFSYLLAG